MKRSGISPFLLVLLVSTIFGATLASPLAAEGPAKPATAVAPSTSAELIKAEAEKTKAEAELKKIEVDLKKAADARTQFYLDWIYRVGLALAAILLLIRLIPQVSEITLPWAGGTLSVKRAPKQPLTTGPAPPPVPSPVITAATEILKRTLEPGPAVDKIVDRVEETEIYQAVGITKDMIYVCHHAKKIPRSEYYQVRIYLDAEGDAILDKVEKVTYRLHPTFTQREITLTNRAQQFQHEISAWGEFMLYALVYFKGEPRSVELKRYLNF